MNNTSVVPAVKPGWQTSEFWVTAIASIIAILNTALGWQIEPTALATVGGMIAAYALSRMGTKRSAIAAANDANTAAIRSKPLYQ
ncbi:MAG: hypothetical protein H0X34_17930 [Chthoniobacterales bacterium]|jgi:hypothetical protein|nr:hypothetical protein [Chthoniobacterales bacterium]